MATTCSRLATVARYAAVCALATVWSCWSATASAGTIDQSSFKIEIVDSLEWLDNKDDPYVAMRLSRMTTMQKTVMDSRPYVRITNLSNQSGHTQADLYRFDLDLSNSSSKVTDVEWINVPGKTTWGWDDPTQTANLNFYDPIKPGDAATMRLTTGALATASDTYSLLQNYFAPMLGSPAITYGILKLYAAPAGTFTARGLNPDDRIDVTGISPVQYNLKDYPVDYYDTSAGLIGVSIQPVPEPSSLALLAAAGAMGLLGLGRRRAARRVA